MDRIDYEIKIARKSFAEEFEIDIETATDIIFEFDLINVVCERYKDDIENYTPVELKGE